MYFQFWTIQNWESKKLNFPGFKDQLIKALLFFTKRKKMELKKKQKQETTHTYIRTKMHTPFEPQSYVTHLLPTQTPIHNMIYDIFDWYTTKISLCYTWFFHCLSGWRWSDVMWWPCSRDNEIHVSTAAVRLKKFPGSGMQSSASL